MADLTLRLETEDWRELLSAAIDEAESEFGVDLDSADYNSAADAVCCDVLERLDNYGVTYQQASHQSKGAFVIVQHGTPKAVATFDDAVAAAMPLGRELVRRIASSAVAVE